MSYKQGRNMRGRCRPESSPETRTVVTSRADCCKTPETLAEELYIGATPEILVTSCCDPLCGRTERIDSNRCNFWPSFAHPRWLTCNELYNGNGRI